MSDAEEVERTSLAGRAEEAEELGPLPDAVRARVVALAAEAIGRMPAETLPAPLKRVATFAPGRRAKLAGNQIAGVLETDAGFREHVARQVRVEAPEIAEALDAGARPAVADPVDLAAMAYLLRPEGWRAILVESSEQIRAERAGAVSKQTQDQVERLRRQVEMANEELKEVRQRQREELARLKLENSELRHKLGDARAKSREAAAAAEQAERDLSETRRAANSAAAAADAETRRLRSRVEELEGELAAVRRAERVERGTGTMRARLLLDTLIESAQGLRRELALPAVDSLPADAVEADQGERGHRTPSGHGSLATDDPAVLEHLLALPKADRKSTRLNSSHSTLSRMPSSA